MFKCLFPPANKNTKYTNKKQNTTKKHKKKCKASNLCATLFAKGHSINKLMLQICCILCIYAHLRNQSQPPLDRGGGLGVAVGRIIMHSISLPPTFPQPTVPKCSPCALGPS